MKDRSHRGGLVGPLLLIGIGVIFLLQRMDLLAINFWDFIFRLWPILLIAIGIDLLIARRSIWGSLIALILIIAVMVGGVYLLGVQAGTSLPAETIRESLGTATEVELSVNPGIGFLRIQALDSSDKDLVDGRIRVASREQLTKDIERQNDAVRITLRSNGGEWIPAVGAWGDERLWDLGLNPGVAWDLDLDMGLGRHDLQLRGLNLTSLALNMGIGQNKVTLPEKGNLRGRIEGAIGETVLIIPEGMAVRLRMSTGLASRQVPSGFSQQGDVYTSPGYDSAENRAELEINQAIGVIRVR
jgi:hypothetical protein